MSPRAATVRDNVVAALARGAARARARFTRATTAAAGAACADATNVSRPASAPLVRVAAAGGELRPLDPSDPAAEALAAAAEAVLSAAQHGSRR